METEARARGLAGWARRRALGDSVSGHRVAAAKVPGAYTRIAAPSVNAGAHVSRTTNHQSHFSTHAFLIATRQLLEIELTSSQQTRKHFPIATFYACLGWRREFANHPKRDCRSQECAARG
jgi:hypothetical protein